VRIRLWGTRGSLPSPGPHTLRYGGNTPCVEVRDDDGALLVLDAGTGIRALGTSIEPGITRVDILLTHLHIDHILGLGFFGPLERADLEVHIWGPASTPLDLEARLVKYLSPPLFPVRLHDLPCRLTFHDVPLGQFAIAGFEITAALVCHPGPTVGYRIADRAAVMAYIPDHEPALGVRHFPEEADWTSGFDLSSRADLLIHDAQYTDAEYPKHVGWGHSALSHAIAFATVAKVRRLVAFHHDPNRSDAALDRLMANGLGRSPLPFRVIAGKEGTQLRLAAPRGRRIARR
jgi:phosphoribosyl 1,2-cyclic phosphodiesterase